MPRAARKTSPRPAHRTSVRKSPWSALLKREDQIARAALLGLAAGGMARTPRRGAPEAVEMTGAPALVDRAHEIDWHVVDGAEIGTLDDAGS